MGWLFQERPIDRAYCEQNIVPKYARLIDYSKQGSKHWLLIEANISDAPSLSRDFDPDCNGTVRFIALILTQVDRSSRYAYGHKDIDETMGPYEVSCPMRLIKKASPRINDEYGWRERVVAFHANQRAKRSAKLEAGQIIELEDPLRFTDGKELSRFVVVHHKPPFAKRTRVIFKDPLTGQHYRISHISSRNYRVVDAADAEAA